jgi:hypothetical protein
VLLYCWCRFCSGHFNPFKKKFNYGFGQWLLLSSRRKDINGLWVFKGTFMTFVGGDNDDYTLFYFKHLKELFTSFGRGDALTYLHGCARGPRFCSSLFWHISVCCEDPHPKRDLALNTYWFLKNLLSQHFHKNTHKSRFTETGQEIGRFYSKPGRSFLIK